jgi:hypothetical protein
MMSAKEDSETLRIETLRERIFFAARDGLAITLYALLSELSPSQQSELLSQVKGSSHFFSLIYLLLYVVYISDDAILNQLLYCIFIVSTSPDSHMTFAFC